MSPQETPMTNPQSVDEGKVDVLAVMGDCIAKRDLNLADMRKAWEATADLIEAVYQYEREFNNPTPDYRLRLNRRIAMFDALARIGARP